MSLDELKKKFIEQVKLRGFDDKYIDAQEEKEILQMAVAENVTVDSARSALRQVCDQQGYACESVVMERLRDTLDTFAGNDGKIDEKEFKDAVTICRKSCHNHRSEIDCKRMVVRVIDDMGYKIKTGMLSNWMKRVKKEIGMA